MITASSIANESVVHTMIHVKVVTALVNASRWTRGNIFGLLLIVITGTCASLLGNSDSRLSAPVIALFAGFIMTNIGILGSWSKPALELAAGRLLKIGIALLGFRLAFSEISQIGSFIGIVVIVLVVFLVFAGIHGVGNYLKIPKPIILLVATGFSICGISAIAAMKPLSRANDEEIGYAIGLVTLFGSISVFTLPVIQIIFGIDANDFGWWVGMSVHDTGQVVATASVGGDTALDAAVLVKMCRVLMLAPLIMWVSFIGRDALGSSRTQRPIIPVFILGFVMATTLRSTGIFSDITLETIGEVRSFLITAAMFGLGAGIRIRALRNLGGRPLLLGFISWIVIIGLAGSGVVLKAQW